MVLLQECFQEVGPPQRDILELIDENIAERQTITAGTDRFGRSHDHIIEIDLASALEFCCIEVEEAVKDLQEHLGAVTVAPPLANPTPDLTQRPVV